MSSSCELLSIIMGDYSMDKCVLVLFFGAMAIILEDFGISFPTELLGNYRFESTAACYPTQQPPRSLSWL